MNLAALSAVYPGYIKGQDQLAQLAVEKDKADAIKRQALIEQGLGNTLAQGDQPPPGGLGALGSGPAPQGPGQPSVPMQPGPQAGGPPPPQGQPQGLGALSKGPPGPPPQGQPVQGAPPQQPQGQPTPQQPAMMTVGQMAQQIMRANPQMDFKSPEGARALLGMVERNQQLLAPQAKQELANISLAMKIDQANQKLELGYANLETRKQIADQADQFRMQIAQVRDQATRDHMQQQVDALDKKLVAAKDKTDTQEEGKNARLSSTLSERAREADQRSKDTGLSVEQRREAAAQADSYKKLALTEKGREADQSESGRNARAGTKSRADMVKTATKAGVAVDPSWTDDEIQKHAADAILKKAESTTLSDDQAKYMAEAALADPSLLSRLGSGPTGNANKTKVLGILAQTSKPEALAQGRAGMASSTAEARTAGNQTGRVALGLKELEKFAPLVLSASGKVNRTQYPSVNALVEAASKGTGGTEVITLANNLNALKNAYAQVIARGGQVTEGARKQASDLIDKAYSDGQIKAAVAAMLQEAKAAGQAASEVTGDISGKGKPASAASASGADDPLGIR
jgi:hypothetical protein